MFIICLKLEGEVNEEVGSNGITLCCVATICDSLMCCRVKILPNGQAYKYLSTAFQADWEGYGVCGVV